MEAKPFLAEEALRVALGELTALHKLLDEYEETKDKKKLAEVSQRMKNMLPKIKVLPNLNQTFLAYPPCFVGTITKT